MASGSRYHMFSRRFLDIAWTNWMTHFQFCGNWFKQVTYDLSHQIPFWMTRCHLNGIKKQLIISLEESGPVDVKSRNIWTFE